MIHFGALAYSPRTAGEAQMIAFHHDFTRVELEAELATGPARVEVGFRPGEPKRVVVDGVAERSATGLLGRFAVLVFTPDRIRLVQGAPAMRRTYLDRALVRLWPALAEVPAAYARALAQRNHLLRRLRAGFGAEDALVGWDDVTARGGCRADRGPRAAVRAARAGVCRPPRAARREPWRDAAAAALEHPRGRARGRPATSAAAATSSGPRREPGRTWTTSSSTSRGRDLRRFGSQGEQRRALLALILAEADLLTGRARRAAGAAPGRRHGRVRRRPAVAAARRRQPRFSRRSSRPPTRPTWNRGRRRSCTSTRVRCGCEGPRADPHRPRRRPPGAEAGSGARRRAGALAGHRRRDGGAPRRAGAGERGDARGRLLQRVVVVGADAARACAWARACRPSWGGSSACGSRWASCR